MNGRHIILLLNITFITPLHSTIHIISTSALIPVQFEMRKKEYLHALKVIRGFGYDPYIIENHAPGYSFYDGFSNRVLYTQNNILTYKNKGVRELLSLQKAISMLPFKDDDMIIKVTGRYFFESNEFLRFVEDNPQYDGIFRLFYNSSVFTGCFALRWRYLKEFILTRDIEKMERDEIAIEEELLSYAIELYKSECKLHWVSKIGMTANIFWSGDCTLTHW